MNQLKKAFLKKESFTLNIEKYSALFTARGEMIKASDGSFINGDINYTHAVCWKVPLDEPFTGLNAKELKQELTKKITGGFLKENDRGQPVQDPSLLNLIMADVSHWAKDMILDKDVNYFVKDFQEVYDFKYSVSARIANTALLLEVSYI